MGFICRLQDVLAINLQILTQTPPVPVFVNSIHEKIHEFHEENSQISEFLRDFFFETEFLEFFVK